MPHETELSLSDRERLRQMGLVAVGIGGVFARRAVTQSVVSCSAATNPRSGAKKVR